jgi:hypothetical protein
MLPDAPDEALLSVLPPLDLYGKGSYAKLPCGEVAEWTNAAVSKTVVSVIPAPGVRIPPSPLLDYFFPETHFLARMMAGL